MQKRNIKIIIGALIVVVLIVTAASIKPAQSVKEEKEEREIHRFADEILNNNSVITTKPNLSTNIDNTEDAVGLYEDENHYYFRGNVENNYLLIGNEFWRIVSINKDSSVEIIKDTPITAIETTPFNSKYDSTDYETSTLKEELESWYQEYLKDLDEYILIRNYCTKYDKTCLKTLPLKIGLLDEEEAIKAGLYPGLATNGSYLTNSFNWWLISNNTTEVDIEAIYCGYLNELGMIDTAFVDEEQNIRPVIYLDGSVDINGEGTKESPYTLNIE